MNIHALSPLLSRLPRGRAVLVAVVVVVVDSRIGRAYVAVLA